MTSQKAYTSEGGKKKKEDGGSNNRGKWSGAMPFTLATPSVSLKVYLLETFVFFNFYCASRVYGRTTCMAGETS